MSADPSPKTPAATITVALGSRSYDVLIGPGLMAVAADLIAARLGKAKCGIVTDANVAPAHLAPLEASLKGGGKARKRSGRRTKAAA